MKDFLPYNIKYSNLHAMAVQGGKKITHRYRTGSIQWTTPDDVRLFLNCNRWASCRLGEYDCTLHSSVLDSDVFGKYTIFYVTDTPEQFSCSYTMSLINSDGTDCLTTKGSIRGKAKNVLMTVYNKYLQDRLPTSGYFSLRISWVMDEDRGMPKQAEHVEPEKDVIKLLEVLSNNLEHFYESKANSDFVLRVGETQFPVHRQMLAARSRVFEAMFRHDTSESRSGTVDIPDTDADIMSDVIFYVYTGKIRNLSAESAVPMYIVADKYALMELRDKCKESLLQNLTLENFCDAAVLAFTYNETELENKVVLFIEERMKELIDNENWKNFLKNKADLASKLLCSALLTKQEKLFITFS